jgi:hypothetical protein
VQSWNQHFIDSSRRLYLKPPRSQGCIHPNGSPSNSCCPSLSTLKLSGRTSLSPSRTVESFTPFDFHRLPLRRVSVIDLLPRIALMQQLMKLDESPIWHPQWPVSNSDRAGRMGVLQSDATVKCLSSCFSGLHLVHSPLDPATAQG